MELSNLLLAAWLLPLASFVVILFAGRRLGKNGEAAGKLATGAIVGSLLLSCLALFGWLSDHPLDPHLPEHGAHEGHGDHPEHEHDHKHVAGSSSVHLVAHQDEAGANPEHAEDEADKPYQSGTWYTLAKFGNLRMEIGYYIDALTVGMFVMVTLIASCIHFYSQGYMHEELEDVTDHEVRLANGKHLHRPGRYHRFFQYLSLFCFSMLGLVVAGNIFMVFVFWELVGICSYFLIGFYIERHSASTAANKAFIVNRVGDFGFLIGLMALWGALGTFAFGDTARKTEDGKVVVDAEGKPVIEEYGLFSRVRPESNGYSIVVPDEMVKFAAADEIAAGANVDASMKGWRGQDYGYWLLCVAGLGVFCGCVGKSAQFPLQTWLPDAMEGPTPVSALVHSATMVAAGVYLVARFYPVFTPEVQLVIAYIGAITLFIAATIAIVATDIKRVLAFSTVSQLGYMMLGLGVGGWLAGVHHLVTHAFFKSLLFMCSGSVIHACHTNEMTKMGGLRHKMPWTAYTMLVGCLAIAGAGVPLADIGFSGYYSKDSIIAHCWAYATANPVHGILFIAPVVGAAITAFYMFRLWFMTFAGPPKDQHIYDHAHESPKVMYIPLVVLAFFALGVSWSIQYMLAAAAVAGFFFFLLWMKNSGAQDYSTRVIFGTVGVAALLAVFVASLADVSGWKLDMLLTQGAPLLGTDTAVYANLSIPNAHDVHAAFHEKTSIVACSTAILGIGLAVVFYGLRILDPAEVAQQTGPIYRFLLAKWKFDELYDLVFVRTVHLVAGWIATLDKEVIDRFLDNLARWTVTVSRFDDYVDRNYVDHLFDKLADWAWDVGSGLHTAQTGRLRQYVMFLAVGTVALFVLVMFWWNFAGTAQGALPH